MQSRELLIGLGIVLLCSACQDPIEASLQEAYAKELAPQFRQQLEALGKYSKSEIDSVVGPQSKRTALCVVEMLKIYPEEYLDHVLESFANGSTATNAIESANTLLEQQRESGVISIDAANTYVETAEQKVVACVK